MTGQAIFLGLVLALAGGLTACGGGAGRGAAADGPPPSGNGPRRSLELEEAPTPTPASTPPAGDGTSTPEIVNSVEKDRP